MGNLRDLGWVGAEKPGRFPAESLPIGRRNAAQIKKDRPKGGLVSVPDLYYFDPDWSREIDQ
jgi:hypothetical protein